MKYNSSESARAYKNLILVNVYVLQNKPQKAWVIYRKYKNQIFPGTNTTYKENFLADLDALEATGIFHPEFKKIREYLTR